MSIAEKKLAEPQTQEVQSVDLSQIDAISEEALGILQLQVQNIKKAAKTKNLTVSQLNSLTEIVRTLSALKRANTKPSNQKGDKEKEASKLELELSQMSRDQLLELVSPALLELGVDLASLPITQPMMKEEDNGDSARSRSESKPKTQRTRRVPAGGTTRSEALTEDFEVDSVLD